MKKKHEQTGIDTFWPFVPLPGATRRLNSGILNIFLGVAQIKINIGRGGEGRTPGRNSRFYCGFLWSRPD
jgi:hypothetical protein